MNVSPTDFIESVGNTEFKALIARHLNVGVQEVFENGLTLREVLAISPTAVNSIDLMEAFVAAIADSGGDDDIDLPVITLDDSFDAVVKAIQGKI